MSEYKIKHRPTCYKYIMLVIFIVKGVAKSITISLFFGDFADHRILRKRREPPATSKTHFANMYLLETARINIYCLKSIRKHQANSKQKANKH